MVCISSGYQDYLRVGSKLGHLRVLLIVLNSEQRQCIHQLLTVGKV